MWWGTEDDGEHLIREVIDRLVEKTLEHELPETLVYGVGAAIWNGRRSPLLIVDCRLDPRRDKGVRIGGKLISRMVYDLLGPLRPLSYHAMTEHQGGKYGLGALDLIRHVAVGVVRPDILPLQEFIFGALADAGHRFGEQFEDWNLPEDLIVLFARPAKSLNSIGVSPLFRRRMIGSIGLVGTMNRKSHGFTTAGHLVERVGDVVSYAARVLGQIVRFGERKRIVLHSDPQGRPGYDFAVAVSDTPTNVTARFLASGVVVSDPRTVRDHALCKLDGAISGQRWGVVSGSLRLGQAGQRQWRNCWNVVGKKGWFCKQGDSGGLVALESGAILGTLVGGLKIGGWLSRNRMEIGFVQDLQSTIEFVRLEYGFDIVVS